MKNKVQETINQTKKIPTHIYVYGLLFGLCIGLAISLPRTQGYIQIALFSIATWLFIHVARYLIRVNKTVVDEIVADKPTETSNHKVGEVVRTKCAGCGRNVLITWTNSAVGHDLYCGSCWEKWADKQ